MNIPRKHITADEMYKSLFPDEATEKWTEAQRIDMKASFFIGFDKAIDAIVMLSGETEDEAEERIERYVKEIKGFRIVQSIRVLEFLIKEKRSKPL